MKRKGIILSIKSVMIFIILSFAFINCSPAKDPNALSAEGHKYIDEGKRALAENNIDKALELFTKATETDPKNIAGYMNRGLALLIYTQYAKDAVDDFSTVIELDSANADAYNNRGLAYSYMGAINSSMDDFDKALKLDPKFTQAFINRGSCFLHWKQYDKAIGDFSEALRLSPNNPEVFYQRGLAHYKMKAADSAIMDYNKAIELGYDREILYQNRGNAYFKLGKFNESIEDYLKVIGFNPDNINARNNLAVAYDTTGQIKKAQTERKILADLAVKMQQADANKLPDIKDIKFKRFSAPGDLFTVELPEDWNMKVNKTENSVEVLITKEKLEEGSGDYTVGVKLTLETEMEKKYKVVRGDELLDFWIASSMKNAEDYYDYRIFQKKSLKKGNYLGFLQKTMIQLAEEQKPLRLYEYILAKYNVIFFAYFQCSEDMSEYYSKIFDRAVETLYVKEVNKI